MPRYIKRHYRTWHAVLDIPKALRPKFNGRARFKQSLKTESQSEAELRALPLIAQWKREIELARSGVESVEATVADFRRGVDEYSEADARELADDILVTEGSYARNEPNKPNRYQDLEDAYAVVFKGRILLAEHFDSWKATLDEYTDKYRDMMLADVREFLQRFQYADEVKWDAVYAWVEDGLKAKQGNSATTCKRKLAGIRNYWQWLQDRKGVDRSIDPFRGVVRERKTKAAAKPKGRLAYTVQDYHKLLNAVPVDDELLSDLIRVGAHTGMRIEELCSLRCDDVDTDRFTIADAKTSAGNRVVPIHRDIAQLVTRLKDTSKDGFLISGLSQNKYGDRSNAIGKRFGRLKNKLGYGPRHVFHSWRNTIASQLQTAGVPESHAAPLIGHEIQTMTYGVYSNGVEFSAVKDALDKVSYR
ncbi:tyrosine-type recombinase/integrase [Boseongicola aestuarii]|uniref:Site-specific tyrosine recombinase XerC n=1 Tax=Boseongicola aestuarii TaxID=1470561 RepID=A0A238J251_9RHOB|nr:tyrosine-type recombinase/integrase [Boseongicola aestuarii]SMX24040.1 site-specific tyrosine recombinase XerC [Boseongicola aestuarii]